MPKISYIFGDILTGSVIAEIPAYGVSMTRGFGSGDLRGTFQLDQTGKTNKDLLDAVEEGRSFVICERDKVPIWGGFVRVSTYQAQAKSLQLYCQAFEHYPSYRLIRSDFENLNTEQRNIFVNLWTAMQVDPNSINVTLPSSFSTVIQKSITVKAFEFKSYREIMDSIANTIDGFDWTIDIQQNVGGSYPRILRVGYPTLGATEPIHLDYPGSIINYWYNSSMTNRATHFYGIGAGEGSTMLTQEVIHTDLIASGFPRFDMDLSFKSITDPTLLTARTMHRAAMLKPGIPVMTAEVKFDQNLEPQFGSFGLGDAVTISFKDDPRHPEPVNQTLNTRIIGWEYYPPSNDHTEMARLLFEGEQ